MVLLHGFTDTWKAWRPVLPALAAHHDVVAWSLPGHSGGEPWDRSVPFSTSSAADVLERQMNALGIDRAHLVGNSLGGWMALELAARGRALSVVGVCPAGGWDPGGRQERRAARYFRRNQVLLRRFGPLLPFVARHPSLRRLALRDLVADPRRVSTDDALAMFEGARDCTVADDVLALARSGDPFGRLGPIPCAVTILVGSHDRLLRWPDAYTRMRLMLPDAQWICMQGLGHLPMWDDPLLLAQSILRHTAANRTAVRA
jgi:pimeloyl-ACP methyl ester carboxylesterase